MKTAFERLSAVMALAGVLCSVEHALAAESKTARDLEIDDLKARLERLEKESAGQKQEAPKAAGAQWSFDNGRPTVKSADGQFEMALRGRFHADAAAYRQDSSDFGAAAPADHRDLGSGAVFRRAQFGVEGKVWRDWQYEMRFNFGGSDAESANSAINIMRLAYTGIPNARINAGVIQPVFTLADSISSNDVTFLERAAVVTAATDAFGGSDSRRGIEATYQKSGVFDETDNLVVSAAVTGQTTGSAHSGGASLDDEGTQVLGRVAYRAYSDKDANVQIGFDAARVMSLQGTTPGTAQTLQFRERPEMRVDGTRLVDTGTIPAESAALWGIEGGANWKNFYVAAEYYDWSVDRDTDCSVGCSAGGDPGFSGWYVEGSWIVTGESKKYTAAGSGNSYGVFGAPKPAEPFSFGGGLGAIELAARYSELDLNWNEGAAGAATPVGGIRGGEQRIATLGVNWYVNSNIRTMLDYSFVDVDRLNSAGAQQGQTLGVFGTRLQFAF